MPIKNTETTRMKEFNFQTRCRVCGKTTEVTFSDGSPEEAVINLRTRAGFYPDKFHKSNCPTKSVKDLEF